MPTTLDSLTRRDLKRIQRVGSFYTLEQTADCAAVAGANARSKTGSC